MAYGENEKMEQIKAFIEQIQFGSVVITIHDGQITQIDRTEKVRFSTEKKKTSPKKSEIKNKL